MNENRFRYFVLSGSYDSGRGYRSSRKIGIVAQGIEQAIRISKSLYPNTTIYDVSHHGIIDVIDSHAEVLIISDTETDGVTMVSKE